MNYSVGQRLYRGYGIDDHGRTGVFETPNKEEIIRYVKSASKKGDFKPCCVHVVDIVQVIDLTPVTQLNLFDLL